VILLLLISDVIYNLKRGKMSHSASTPERGPLHSPSHIGIGGYHSLLKKPDSIDIAGLSLSFESTPTIDEALKSRVVRFSYSKSSTAAQDCEMNLG
jgi:hypothetical protein